MSRRGKPHPAHAATDDPHDAAAYAAPTRSKSRRQSPPRARAHRSRTRSQRRRPCRRRRQTVDLPVTAGVVCTRRKPAAAAAPEAAPEAEALGIALLVSPGGRRARACGQGGLCRLVEELEEGRRLLLHETERVEEVRRRLRRRVPADRFADRFAAGRARNPRAAATTITIIITTTTTTTTSATTSTRAASVGCGTVLARVVHTVVLVLPVAVGEGLKEVRGLALEAEALVVHQPVDKGLHHSADLEAKNPKGAAHNKLSGRS